MVKTKQNKMTIEDLAALMQRTMASKEDITELRTETKGILKDIVEELDATHADIRYILSTVDKLTQSDILQDAAIEDLSSRTDRLEQNIELAK